MLKIDKLFRAPNGSQEPFDLTFNAEDLNIPEIFGPVRVQGNFLRVKEGIMMLIAKLEATQKTFCSRCAKPLKLDLSFNPSEWLFYEAKPVAEDDENEHLQLDTHRLELNPVEPVRQDIILNLSHIPRCKKLCAKFEEAIIEHKGVKALSGLKNLNLDQTK